MTNTYQFTHVPTVFHTPDNDKSIKRTALPENFDWRFNALLSPVSYHVDDTPSPALIMAISCLQDRWSMWNRQYTPPQLSVAYTHNAACAVNIDMSSVEQVWLFLQEHGTIDVEQEGFRARKVYRLADDKQVIRSDIYNHGPITAQFSLNLKAFKKYWTLLKSDESTLSGRNLVYVPPPLSKCTATLTLKIVGWGSKIDNVGCDYWIATHCWGAKAFSKRHEYGKNGYFLITANCGLEQNCFAAFPFFMHMGVKQPPCCQSVLHDDGMFPDICANLLDEVILSPDETGMSEIVPVVLKTGKRVKHKKAFVIPVEIGDMDSQNQHCSTLKHWGVAIEKTQAPTPQIPNDVQNSKNGFGKFGAFVKTVPGEFAVLCLVVIATICLLIAVCLPATPSAPTVRFAKSTSSSTIHRRRNSGLSHKSI